MEQDSESEMTLCDHDWRLTFIRRPHIKIEQGCDLFKYGMPPVIYVRCESCEQIGFRRGESPLVYTWEQERR